MRTRNAGNPRPMPPKRTPPARKSATRTPITSPDSAATSVTPKAGQTTRAAAAKAKQAKIHETSPTPNIDSDSKVEPSSDVLEEINATGDATAMTVDAKVATGSKRTPRKTTKPTPAKRGRKKTPKSRGAVKSNVEESPKEELVDTCDEEFLKKQDPIADEIVESVDKEQSTQEVEELSVDNVDVSVSVKDNLTAVENVGEPTNEETAVENVGGSANDETAVFNVGEPTNEKTAVENVGGSSNDETAIFNVGEPTNEKTDIENVGGSTNDETAVVNVGKHAMKEASVLELEVDANSNVEDSSNQEEIVVAEVSKSIENDHLSSGNGEEAKEECEVEEMKNTDDKESTLSPSHLEVNVKEQLHGKDAEPENNIDTDEGMEEYADRVDLEVHGEEEYAEDDVDEPAEETEGLADEHRELTALAKERKIKKEYEIFVGGLVRDAVEDDVRMIFEKIGEVVEVRLHKNLSNNKNKGYAFVKFANKEHAKRALSEMKNPIICGKRCGTAPCEDNDTLFVGNICNTWTKEAIKQKLKDYGIEGVEHITLVPDVQHEGLSRGFAFLEFSRHMDAMLAYKRLQKPDAIFGHPERTVKVAFAEPLREPDPEVMAQVKSVFVDGLSPHWDEDRVREQFKGYGDIVRVVLARNMSTAKRKDFGFVDFCTHEAAVACIDSLNNAELGDGNSKTKVRARLSNPLPKTQAVKGGMCGGFRIGHGDGGGTFSRGRGFGRGRHAFNRSDYRGRGFYPGARGPTGGFVDEYDLNNPYAEFHARQSFGQGGRRGFLRGGHHASGRGAAAPASSRSNLDRPWYGAPEMDRGNDFPPRWQPYSPEGHYGTPFIGRHFHDPYLYDDSPQGMKRPFYMTDRDPDYIERSRLRPRLDYADPSVSFRGTHYHDNFGASSSFYSHDYYRQNYDGGPFSSYHGGDRSFRGGY